MADLTSVLMELQDNWTRRWEAVGMLKFVFSCANLSWELKQDGIRFLLSIMDGISSISDNDSVDYSIHMRTMYTSLQAIEMVIMYASDSVLRKKAFRALNKVLADIPTSAGFDVLVALIKNSDSSSMIAILLDCFKEEMHSEKIKRGSSAEVVMNKVSQSASFWNPSVLELAEMVLRPPKGNSNCTGILSKDELQKAYNEWLLPLRSGWNCRRKATINWHVNLLSWFCTAALNLLKSS